LSFAGSLAELAPRLPLAVFPLKHPLGLKAQASLAARQNNANTLHCFACAAYVLAAKHACKSQHLPGSKADTRALQVENPASLDFIN